MKDKECISCKHFLMCQGKPSAEIKCVKFEKREPKKSKANKSISGV